jgi:hypothetical protein
MTLFFQGGCAEKCANRSADKSVKDDDRAIPSSITDNGRKLSSIDSARQRSYEEAKESAAQRIHQAQNAPAILIRKSRGAKLPRVIRGNFHREKCRDQFTERELPNSGTDRSGEDDSFGLGERRGHLAFLARTFVIATLMGTAFRRIVGALTATAFARNEQTGETKISQRAAAQRRSGEDRRRQPQHQQVTPHDSFLSRQRR